MDFTIFFEQLLFNLPWYLALMAALVAAIAYWPKYKHTTERPFLYFLLYVIVHEIAGFVLPFLAIETVPLYNGFLIVSFTFYLHWFSTILKKKLLGRFMVLLFLVVCACSIYFESFTARLMQWPYIAGTAFVLINVAQYFLDLLDIPKIFHPHRSQRFWIISGLLIFHLGFLIFLFVPESIDSYGLVYSISITTLNLILYGCYTIGFICLRKTATQ